MLLALVSKDDLANHVIRAGVLEFIRELLWIRTEDALRVAQLETFVDDFCKEKAEEKAKRAKENAGATSSNQNQN